MNALPDDYDACILGRTIGVLGDRLAYSLSRLLQACEGNRDEVIDLMREQVEKHGTDAPVFIDDSLGDDGGDRAPLEPDEPTPAVPLVISPNSPKIIPPLPGTLVPVFSHRKN